MAKLYFWAFSKKSGVGHLALELADGTYFSFWPMTGVNSPFDTRDGSFMENHEKDIKAEGRNPDDTYFIENINVAKMKAYIKSIKEKAPDYTMLFNNCAQMVQKVLHVGFGIESGRSDIAPRQVMDWAKLRDNGELYDSFTEYAYITHNSDRYDDL